MMAVLLPTLRHFRVVNVVALIGTTYTTWFIVVTAAKHGMTPGAASRYTAVTVNHSFEELQRLKMQNLCSLEVPHSVTTLSL